MDHPDFRVNGKVFATLGYPDERFGAVMLTIEDQERFLQGHPEIFTPAKGAWGRQGSTQVLLATVSQGLARKAIAAAWRKRTPSPAPPSKPSLRGRHRLNA